MLHTFLARYEEWQKLKCCRNMGICREEFGQKLFHRTVWQQWIDQRQKPWSFIEQKNRALQSQRVPYTTGFLLLRVCKWVWNKRTRLEFSPSDRMFAIQACDRYPFLQTVFERPLFEGIIKCDFAPPHRVIPSTCWFGKSHSADLPRCTFFAWGGRDRSRSHVSPRRAARPWQKASRAPAL